MNCWLLDVCMFVPSVIFIFVISYELIIYKHDNYLPGTQEFTRKSVTAQNKERRNERLSGSVWHTQNADNCLVQVLENNKPLPKICFYYHITSARLNSSWMFKVTVSHFIIGRNSSFFDDFLWIQIWLCT